MVLAGDESSFHFLNINVDVPVGGDILQRLDHSPGAFDAEFINSVGCAQSKVRDPSRFLRDEVGGGVQFPHLSNLACGDEHLAAQTVAMQGWLSLYGDFKPVVG